MLKGDQTPKILEFKGAVKASSINATPNFL